MFFQLILSIDDYSITYSRNDMKLHFWVQLLSLLFLIYLLGYLLTNNSYFRVHNELAQIEHHYMIRAKKNELFKAD